MKKSKVKGLWRITALLLFSCFLTLTSFAQQKSLSGTIIGEDGIPIPGVTIVVLGTTTGTVTDMDGKFTFLAPATAKVISIAYVGMKTQELTIGTQSSFNVTMISESTGVDEVVVIGYGTRLKEELTGAISTVSSDQMEISTSSSVISRIQGQVSGVTITQSNRPGGDANIRIRGLGTINNNGPLYIIDGVPAGPGNNISPNDVESISILKDASSAAIYGTRGANGVVIITTKRGRDNQQPTINFSVRTGMTRANNQYDLLNTQEYGEAVWLSYKNTNTTPSHKQYGSGATPVIPDYILPAGQMEGAPGTTLADYAYPDKTIYRANKTGTDWYDEIYQNGIVQEYDLSVSGGGKNGTYAFSGSYLDENGLMKNTNFKRYNFRMNSEAKFNDWFKAGESLQAIYIDEHGNFSDNGEGTVMSQAYRSQPIIPVYDIQGNFAGSKAPEMGNSVNPVAMLYRARNNNGKWVRVLGNIYGEVTLLKGLTAKSLLGYNFGQWNYKGYNLPNYEHSEPQLVNGLNADSNYSLQWNWTNTINYNATFASVHKLNVVLGTEAIENKYQSLNASRSQYFLEDPNYMQLNSGEINKDNSGEAYEWSLFSQFGRINYDIMGKYFLEGTVRRDGSSRFSEANRYGVFPAASAAWNISEESFFAGTKNWLDLLKVRLGWGMAGNDQIGNYNSYTTYGSDKYRASYSLDGSKTSAVTGFRPMALGNTDVSWETTQTLNLGLDGTLLNRRLTFAIDVWQRNTSDMLFKEPIPEVIGVVIAPDINIGEMTNTGFDFELGFTNNAQDGKFGYTVMASVSHYKNEIISLSSDPKRIINGASERDMVYTRFAAGSAYPEFYGYIVDGIFQTKAEADAHPQYQTTAYNQAGHFKFRDITGPDGIPDGKITPEDRTFIGSPHPDLTGGLNIDLSYANFDLNMFFYGSYGNKINNYVTRWIDYGMFNGGLSKDALYESWGSPYLSDNANAKLPMLDQSSISQQASTAFLEDGSFLRLKSLKLGYTVPKSILNKAQIKNVYIYVQATNLFTFTKYSGLDPEVNTSGTYLGMDLGAWPTPQQIMFGINLGL